MGMGSKRRWLYLKEIFYNAAYWRYCKAQKNSVHRGVSFTLALIFFHSYFKCFNPATRQSRIQKNGSWISSSKIGRTYSYVCLSAINSLCLPGCKNKTKSECRYSFEIVSPSHCSVVLASHCFFFLHLPSRT